MKRLFAPSLALAMAAVAASAASCSQETEGEIIPSLPVDTTPPTISVNRPPALSGGTLLVTRDASHALVADPDRDRLVLVDLDARTSTSIELEPGDEPGRAVEDPSGLLHVALRGGGAVVSVSPALGKIVGRRQVCAAPRGIADIAESSELVVACANGDVARLPADPLSQTPVEIRYLEPDLRDVAVVGTEIWISHLRGGEVVRLDAKGQVLGRQSPSTKTETDFDGEDIERAPTTAWRMIPTPDGRVLLSHQMARSAAIDLGTPDDEGGGEASYASQDCADSLEQSALTVVGSSGAETFGSGGVAFGSLPVDVAFSSNGERIARLDAGTGAVVELRMANLEEAMPCADSSDEIISLTTSTDQPVALAYGKLHDLWVQTREPALLKRFRDGALIDSIALGGASRADSGYDLFHLVQADTMSGLSCASCHPEGRDDGHTWFFTNVGARRTQSLAGTVADTAPYHWAGDLTTFDALMREVFERRMGGRPQSSDRVAALSTWVQSVARVPFASDAASPDAVSRGDALFHSPLVGCATCHSGATLTNDLTLNVGTGGAFQVPSLVGVGMRGPWMHDGCATTLHDRFAPSCGGEAHGQTAQLSSGQVDDLVAFMNTL